MTVIGWIIGIAVMTNQYMGLFGVYVIFLIHVSESVQEFGKEIISLGSIFVSV